MTRAVAVLLILLAAAPGPALERPLPPLLTLDAAIAWARDHSPLLARADHDRDAALAALDSARGGRWGELSATATWTRHQDDVTVRPMSADLVERGFDGLPFDRNQLTAGVEAEVPLYTGGGLSATIDAASARASAAGQRRTATAAEVVAGVRTLYARTQAAAAARAAAAAWVTALETRARDISTFVEAGRAPQLDLDRVRAELAGARAEAASAAARHDASLARLLALIGADPAARPDLEPLPERLPGAPPPLTEVRPLVLASPDVRAAEGATAAARGEAAAARARRLPQLVARAAWTAHDAPSVGDPLETWSVGLAVRLPLFDGGGRAARAAAATAEADASKAAADQLRRDRLAELEAAAAHLEAAHTRVDEARAGLAAAAAVRNTERVRYDTGAGPVRDLLEAEARLAGAEAALAGAIAEVLTASAELNRICGQEVVS